MCVNKGSIAPKLDGPTSTISRDVKLGEKVSFLCKDIALVSSTPTIQWFSENGDVAEMISSSTKYTINTMNNGRTSELVIHYADSDAKYRCVFSNAKGKTDKQFSLKVHGRYNGVIASIVVTIIIVIAAVAIGVRLAFVRSINRQKVLYSYPF